MMTLIWYFFIDRLFSKSSDPILHFIVMNETVPVQNTA